MSDGADRPPVSLSRWMAAQVARRRWVAVAVVVLACGAALMITMRPADGRVMRLTGRVTSVGSDATLIVALHDGRRVRVALLGVAVPEEWRAPAGAWLAERGADKPVTVTFAGEPSAASDPMQGYIYTADHHLLNEAMLREGYGVADSAAVHTLGPWMARLSHWARQDGRGLWEAQGDRK